MVRDFFILFDDEEDRHHNYENTKLKLRNEIVGTKHRLKLDLD